MLYNTLLLRYFINNKKKVKNFANIRLNITNKVEIHRKYQKRYRLICLHLKSSSKIISP